MEWKNWKSVNDMIKIDDHHAEMINVCTGEVLENMDDDLFDHVKTSYRKDNCRGYNIIHHNDVGDAFCTIDWSKH